MRVIAIDQGTSSTRGLVLDETGHKEIVCTCQHQQLYPRPGWVEHDPEELLQHIRECLIAAGPVDAIGIDNQGESCLAWDRESGQAISPLIVWQDRRTTEAIEKLKAEGAQELTMARAGLPLDPYFSASKLSWLLENIPQARDLLAKGRLHLGTSDAFFIERLTGKFVTDITTASRTSLLNLKTGQWDPDLCELFNIPIEALPQIKPTYSDTGDNFGTVKLNGKEVPITASVVDQQAALFGHGCRIPGDAKITFGTGAFALALTGNSIVTSPDHGLLPTIAWQQANEQPSYALDGAVYCASSALNWARSLGLFASFDEINRFDAGPAITRDLVFVPALNGLACPYWEGSAAGLWIGMALDTSSDDMVQAILEGVALRAAEVIDAMSGQVAITDSISIDGGMSTNPYFCQFLANILQKQIIVPAEELTAIGTAMMAMGSTDITKNKAPLKTIYEPLEKLEGAKSRFAEAVDRCRNWRT